MAGKQRYGRPDKTFAQAFLNPGDSTRDVITAAREQTAWIENPKLAADLAAVRDVANALIKGNSPEARSARAFAAALLIHDAPHRKGKLHAKLPRLQV